MVKINYKQFIFLVVLFCFAILNIINIAEASNVSFGLPDSFAPTNIEDLYTPDIPEEGDMSIHLEGWASGAGPWIMLRYNPNVDISNQKYIEITWQITNLTGNYQESPISIFMRDTSYFNISNEGVV